MKRIFAILPFVLMLLLSACSSNDPELNLDKGKLEVVLSLEGFADIDSIDFSEYYIAIIPESGWIYSEEVKNITWPLDVNVGKYKIAAASPLISKTDTTVTYYYGEKDATIIKDQTTIVNLTLQLTDYPKSDLDD